MMWPAWGSLRYAGGSGHGAAAPADASRLGARGGSVAEGRRMEHFAGHAEVDVPLDSDLYDSRRHHSWERELSEHTNGLARILWPK